MGGNGSGSWQSGMAKDTCEETKCLDVFRLRKIGVAFDSYSAGVLSWKGTSKITYRLLNNQFHVNYRFTTGPRVGQTMEYAIQVVTTKPYYGGLRYWFLCPTCGQRVAKLYLAHAFFECRTCANLAYESTRSGLREMWRIIASQDRRLERVFKLAGLEQELDAMSAVSVFRNMTIGASWTVHAQLKYERLMGKKKRARR